MRKNEDKMLVDKLIWNKPLTLLTVWVRNGLRCKEDRKSGRKKQKKISRQKEERQETAYETSRV